MLTDRPRVVETIQRITSAAGYTLGDIRRPSHINWKVGFRYRNLHGAPDSIRADVGFLWRHPLYPIHRHPLPPVFAIDGTVGCLDVNEVYAGKFAALASRALPRDLYDGYGFEQKGIGHDPARLYRAFIFHALMQDASMGHVASYHAEAVTDRSIRQELWPLLAANDRPSRSEMLAAVRPRLDRLCTLSPEAMRFQKALLGGTYDPKLLFPEADHHPGLMRHPAGLHRAAHPRRSGRSSRS